LSSNAATVFEKQDVYCIHICLKTR